MHQTVEDSVGDRGICDQLVPMLDGNLAGHDCRATAVAVVNDVEQVAALLRGERLNGDIPVADVPLDTVGLSRGRGIYS